MPDQELTIASMLLLTEAEALCPKGRWLVLGGQAALADALARYGAEVAWFPVDVRERDLASANVVVYNSLVPGAYGRVVVPIPPERDLARRSVLTAREALAPGEVLLLAGPNAEGAKSVIADAGTVFGAPVAEHYRQKHRIARFTKREASPQLPGWASAVGMVLGTWQPFEVDLHTEVLSLETQPGVFAGGRLDAGTQLLLQHLDVPEGSRVLDVGCGAGVIGVAASRRGAGHVDLVDANLLAVEAAARNVARLNVNGRVLASDVYSAVAGERYDLIVSNPPFHRGKQVDYSVADRLISDSPRHLTAAGRVLIVANAFLAYGKHMDRVYRHVETIASTRKYHVLAASDPR